MNRDKDPDKLKDDEPLRPEDSTQAKSPVGLLAPQPALHSDKELARGDVVLDRYKVLSRIGRGAMGCVYRVEQLSIRKQVALKTLIPIAASDVNMRRFQNEALAASKLEHPNLVRALDYGWLGNQPFLVMDLIEGPTLAQYLKEHATLSLPTIYQIFIPICFALAYAHKEGVIHRDIKPSNIVLARNVDGTELFIPKLVDFGIAKLSSEDQALTKTGEVFGTPLYMSPEQCLGSKVDNRSDIYSLGCVLYEALTGAPPFTGQSALETMMQHKSNAPLSLRQAALGGEFPEGLQTIVSNMLEKVPNQRYQNCLDVAEDLARLQHDRAGVVKQTGTSVAGEKTKRSLPKPLVFTTALISIAIAIGSAALLFQSYVKTKENRISVSTIETPAGTKTNANDTDVSNGTARGAQRSLMPTETSSAQYARIVGNDRVFEFGSPSIGAMCVMIAGNFDDHARWRDCIRSFSFPKDKPLLFNTNAAQAYEHPNMFNRFNPDDLRGLRIHSTEAEALTTPNIQLDNPLTYASQFTGLQYLNLRNNNVTIAGLHNMHIERMNRLETLILTDTQIDGKDLVQDFPKMLSRLHRLEMSHLKNVSKVLSLLRGSKNMRFLILEGSDLSNSDLACIATMPNLTGLILPGNRIVDDRSLAKFSHLRALFQLSISRTKVTPACVNELAKFPALQQVTFSSDFKSHAKELRQALPRCIVDFEDAAVSF